MACNYVLKRLFQRRSFRLAATEQVTPFAMIRHWVAAAVTQERTPDCARDLDCSCMFIENRSSHRWQMRTTPLARVPIAIAKFQRRDDG